MLRHNLMIQTAAILFAADAAPAGNTPKAPAAPAATPATTGAKVKPPQGAVPEITTVGYDMPPVSTSKRGNASIYPFEALGAPQRDETGKVIGMASFGVKNKTKKEMIGPVANQNRKSQEDKRDPTTGAIVYKMTEIKDASGAVIGKNPTTEAERVATKHFFAVDVDPKTDKDGASVRVYRDL